MSKFFARGLGGVAAGLIAVAFSPAGLAFATGDADANVTAPQAGDSAVIAASSDAGATATAPAPAVPPAALATPPAATPPAASPAPANGCHLVWANIFGPVCMPGK